MADSLVHKTNIMLCVPGQTLLSQSVPELDIIAMEKEIKKWWA